MRGRGRISLSNLLPTDPSPQTKKKRPSRRVHAEKLNIPPVNEEDQMQVDEKPIVPRPRNLDVNFVDDDELQAALTRSRRAKLQKPKKMSSEEIAKRSLFDSSAT